ncbi:MULTISPECIES: antA/AntB antirepressor family protein [Flavobacterium]|uniref:AntA/AntB antirepressor family protein n=1 Tax=Flavobacterium keumense TaxID=1306518 RepID=A0ABY8N3I7_9FLAO|nr:MULTISPECIES: antA/AntB antirepressor family protein [Flavobacterium]WGK93824.1 antA/AntB antirepressor family protein [Flavobacterium keumense]
MENLINITTNEQGLSVVSARELHSFLDVKTEFKDWMPRMLEYGFEEDKDFSSFLSKSTGGRPSKEFALTIDTAKEIAMIQRSEKGKQARTYFIECEKIAKSKVKPLTQAEQLYENAKLLLEIDRKQKETDRRIDLLEAKTQTLHNYFTIVGFANLNNINCGLQLASKLGRICKAEARREGYMLETMPDPRFGVVNLYPVKLLIKIFTEQNLISN